MHMITLPVRCDRAAAEALLPEFHAALGTGALAIDASATTHIGQAMLQVLVSARQSAEVAHITPSPALSDIARAFGLASVLFDTPESFAGDA